MMDSCFQVIFEKLFILYLDIYDMDIKCWNIILVFINL